MKHKEPKYPAILAFIKGDLEAEYVVLATEGPIDDHKLHGYEFSSAQEVDEDFLSMPTDTPLHKR